MILVFVLILVQSMVAIELIATPSVVTEPKVAPSLATEPKVTAPVAVVGVVKSPEIGRVSGGVSVPQIGVGQANSVGASPLLLKTVELLRGVSASLSGGGSGIGGGRSSGGGFSGGSGMGGGFVSADVFLRRNQASQTTLLAETWTPPGSKQDVPLTIHNDVGMPLPDGTWVLLLLALGYVVRRRYHCNG